MRLQTNLVRRGAKYYYRGRVPRDLKAHYGKTELLISLKTADRRLAEEHLIRLKAQLYDEFAKLRDIEFVPILLPSAITAKPGSLASPEGTTERSLDDLIDYWASQSEKRPRTLLEARTAARRLLEVAKGTSASQIQKAHAIELKDKLLEQGKSIATIQKQINLLKAIYEVAVANDLVRHNPFTGVKLVKPKVVQKARVPFDNDDLKRIFNSSIYTNGDRPRRGAGEAAFWLPLIALWSGMRLEEIGQLNVDDIREADGCHFIDITDGIGSGKSIKTLSSRRRVPIHEELVKCGFLDFVVEQRDAGETRLFPKLVSTEKRQKTSGWSQWFGGYLRNVLGITDRRKTFHSFRHGFKDACRECHIPKEIHNQLTGHSSGDVGDSYGGDAFPLAPLADAIQRLKFPHLSLEHLYWQATSRESSV